MNKPTTNNPVPRYMEQSPGEYVQEQPMTEAPHLDRALYARETLERYSGTAFDQFQPFILLSNFSTYLSAFATQFNAEMIVGPVLSVVHCPQEKISIVEYQLGSPMAALVMDILSYTHPQCIVMLGLCGGLHRSHQVGDFLIPMAAIRDEGASRHYMPPQVPSLPALLVQQFISQELMGQKIPFKTGVIHSTDYRMWEFDEEFIMQLKSEKASAIDMECSALFTVGFRRKVPVGALMLISDLPLQPGGIKTRVLSETVFKNFTNKHLQCGLDAIKRMRKAILADQVQFRHFHF